MKLFDISPEVLLESATNESVEYVYAEEPQSARLRLINVVMIPLFFAITAFLLLTDGSARQLMVKKPAPVLFIIAAGLVMMASMGVSERTNVTITRSGSQMLFLSSLVFLAYLLRDEKRLLLTVGLAFLTVLMVDIGLYFTLGTGFTEEGGFSGLHRNRNIAGHQYGIATMAFLTLAIQRSNPLFLIAGLVSAALVLNTDSQTSMGAIGIFIVFSLFYRVPIARIIIMLTTLVVTVGMSVYFSLGENNPEIFTNRGELWNFLAPYLWDQPWLGYGFSSFWDVGPESINQNYGDGFITEINTGHNGFIDIMLGTGLAGLTLSVGCLVFLILHLTRLKPRFFFVHYLFIAFLISNVTESFLFFYQNIMWTMLILMTTATYAHYKPERRRRSGSLKSSEFI